MRAKSFKSTLFVLIYILYVVSIFLPVVYDYYLYIPLFLALVLAFQICCDRGRFVCVNQTIVPLILYFAVTLVYRFIGVSSTSIGNYVLLFLKIFSVIVALYFYRYGNPKEKKFISWALLVVVSITIITSILTYKKYPDILVSLIHSENYYSFDFERLNIGALSFCYSVFFLSTVLLKNYIDQRKPHFLLLYLFFSYYILFYSKSGTLMISFLISVFFFIFFYKKKGETRLFNALLIILLMLVGFMFEDSFYKAGYSLSNEIFGDKISARLMTVHNFFNGDLTNSDINILSRFRLIQIDFKNWTQNVFTFLFGNGYHTKASSAYSTDVIENAIVNRAGGHSGVFDILPRYGLLGITLFFLCFSRVSKSSKEHIDTESKSYFYFIIFIVILNSLFNDIFKFDVLFVLISIPSLMLNSLEGKKELI